MTENPFSTQGWNRYSYVGNSPVNFTDPSGYCFMGCFWQPVFRAIGNFFRQNWRAILQITVTGLCHLATGPNPGCAALGSFVSGITSGNLGQALRGAAIAFFTAVAFDAVGTATLGPGHKMPDFLSPAHLSNVAGHALVGCVSAVAQGARCGPGALSAAAGSFAGPILRDLGFHRNLVAHAVIGGIASVAGGGNFANGAITAAYGYLFNQDGARRQISPPEGYREALAKVFDVSPDVIDRIVIWENVPERPEFQGGFEATTRRDLIILKGSGETFFPNLRFVLHEYAHVIFQWNNGLTVQQYLDESRLACSLYCKQYGPSAAYQFNAYEVQAELFAQRHVKQFYDLLMQPKSK